MHVVLYLAILGLVLLLRKHSEATVYEPKQASLISSSSRLSTEHGGFSGSRYDFSSEDTRATWEVYAPATGEYKLTIKYRSIDDAQLQVISGGMLLSTFRCRSTKRWSKWKIEKAKFNLSQGNYSLSLESLEQGGPCVDWVSLGLKKSAYTEKQQEDKEHKDEQEKDRQKKYKIIPIPSPFPFPTARLTVGPIAATTPSPTELSTLPPPSEAPMPARSPLPTVTATIEHILYPTRVPASVPTIIPTRKPSWDHQRINGKKFAVVLQTELPSRCRQVSRWQIGKRLGCTE
ncbi:unnamed protein product [Cylindrotheca closterium]|uniref:CBM6 domain-containing protein n=1 Tax=Cylindrotheca closterium TaxID=2856 RepID=A0AAD2FCJ3_9STRA|nr:unnamed protein product [Cylindrotheca closterium]